MVKFAQWIIQQKGDQEIFTAFGMGDKIRSYRTRKVLNFCDHHDNHIYSIIIQQLTGSKDNQFIAYWMLCLMHLN